MADGTPTVNYGWIKPVVGASVDQWGTELNADLDGIDSTVKGVSTVANAAYPSSNPSGYQTAAQVTTALVSYPLGDNRIINGNFAINQRAYVTNTALVAAVYGHDRWKAGASGCTYTFTAALPDTTVTITAGTLTQIIEAGMIEGGIYTLSWTGTAQARVYQGTPTGSYAASPVVTASLSAGTNTVVEFNTGSLGRVKFENGSIVTPYNRQSLAKSMADCQRYFAKTYTQSQAPGVAAADASAVTIYSQVAIAASFASVVWPFPVLMRAQPTVTLYSPHTGASAKAYLQNGAADGAAVVAWLSDATVTLRLNSVNVAASDFVLFHATASAEL